jgi:hypothetical protein
MRRFFTTFTASFAVIVALQFSAISLVDPWARFNFDMDNITLWRERESKPWLIANYPHNAVMIGTSKLAHVNPVEVDTAEYKFFNASFAGALPEEIWSFLRIFVLDSKLLVLSLDIITMNENTWPVRPQGDWQPASFPNATVAALEYLTNREARALALDYLIHGKPNPGTILRNGGRSVPRELARSNAMAAPDFAGPLAALKGAAFTEFKYSTERVAYLEKIKVLLDERHIPYIVLISPENRQMLEMILASGNQWALDRFRADMIRIFPDAIDYSDSWMSTDENFFRHDPLHYLPSAGAKMIREVLMRRGRYDF